MRRFWLWPGFVFALVILWKFFLAVATVQPIPASDAFFYDGAVVNYVLHGEYINPTLDLALPISGTEVFSAYPPLYQAVLLPWMVLFGTSASATIFLHLLLFGIYAWLVYRILKRSGAPLLAMHLAGAFLFGITFHDRPDSLAHVLGMGAVLAWVRSCSDQCSSEFKSAQTSPISLLRITKVLFKRWSGLTPAATRAWLRWASAGLVVLCLATSLQIGATYAFIGFVSTVMLYLLRPRRDSVLSFRAEYGPVLAMVFVPLVLVLLVMWLCPRCWAGFIEHARQTPTFVGFRMFQPADVLKILRTIPGVLLLAGVLFLLGPLSFVRPENVSSGKKIPPADPLPGNPSSAHGALFYAVLGAAIIVMGASLVAFAANTVAIANYLQPLVVGIGLSLILPCLSGFRFKAVRAGLILAVLLAGIRAAGMSTWGVLLSADVGYQDSIKATRSALEKMGPEQTAAISTAYLYDASIQSKARLVHSDWLGPARPHGEVVPVDEDIRKVKPSLLILTQFDYYRRYAAILRELKSSPDEVRIRVRNKAVIPAPDSSPLLQRVVQHISWAPVIVELSWNE